MLYNAGLWASLPPTGPETPRGVLDNPDAPIGDILLQPPPAPSGSPGSGDPPLARLPLITLPARRAPPRRIRSFGDLGSADNLPDMEAAAAAISLKEGEGEGSRARSLSPMHHSASSPALMRGRGGGSVPVAPTTPLAAAAAAVSMASVFASVSAAAAAAASAAYGGGDDDDDDNAFSSDDDSEEALVPGGGGAALAGAVSSSAASTDYSSADMADGGGSGAWSSEDDTMEVDNGNGNGNAAAQRRRPPLPPRPPTSSAVAAAAAAAASAASSSRRALRVATGSRTLGAASPAAGQQQRRQLQLPQQPRASAAAPPRRALPPAAKPSLIDRVLLTEWADRAAAGLFRYDVAGLPTRLLLAPDGRGGGFVAQFNEGRLTKKRPTEFAKDAVVQQFDEDKFNFLKAAQKEVLFALARDGAPGTPATWSPEGAPCGPDPSLLLINVSPIEYGHVLLVPRVASRLPQLVDVESAALALRFAAEADNPYLRLCYNSLGAFGTVNHLHFQAYFLATPFAVEVAATAPLPPLPPREVVAGDGNNNSARFGVAPASLTAPRVSTTVGYPARALVFEATRGDLDGLAAALGDACTRLAAANVPHNVFVVDCGQRAFLFPNLFGTHKANGTVPEDLLETQVDPACFELAGHMVFKRRGDFHDLREDEAYNLVWRLLAAATPEPEEFARIVRIALAI